MSVTELQPGYLIEDLANSGLVPSDVKARIAGPAEKAATNTPMGVDAYVLPYPDMWGKPTQFYRVKLINSPDPTIRYKQVATAPNHVYFPYGFADRLRGAKYLIITEGEKKAAAAVKAGFACVAFSGVDSWKNRTVVLHKDSQIGTNANGQVVAKLPPGASVNEKADTMATGLTELIGYALKKKLPVIIIYDTDIKPNQPPHARFEVQRAAATLGFELRYQGIEFHHIKQVVLDPEDVKLPLGTDKVGLDDFLLNEDLGKDALEQQIHDALGKRTAFPRHPNTREYVNKKMQRTSLSRSELQALGIAVTSDLDARGIRLYCPDDENMYYFDEASHQLLKVRFSQEMSFSQTKFGIKLYNDYGLTPGDGRLMTIFSAQFNAETPVQEVHPEKIVTTRGDTIYYQITDGQMVKIDKHGIRFTTNGNDNVLFEGGMVKPIDPKKLREAIAYYTAQEKLPNIWYDVLKDARIKASEDDNTRRLLSLLYSISPWMYKWRGTQLPLEQMLGEAGSGKSTLFALRQTVLTGMTSLKNAPKDLRDWTASIANTGALHVTDNVHMANGGLKQQLSDELCRVITAAEPHIEARKLYSDNDLIKVPVKAVFAVTAIKQPFTNTDIIQRSIIAELDKGSGEVRYESAWEEKQLARFGGRERWIAHEMVFLHRLLKVVATRWRNEYPARYRLINVEQLLLLSAEVYGWPSDWVPGFLEGSQDSSTIRTDDALSGLFSWASEMREIYGNGLTGRGFTTKDMVAWFEGEEQWEENTVLTNGRMLGKYLAEKQNTVALTTGVLSTDLLKGNYKVYKVNHNFKSKALATPS